MGILDPIGGLDDPVQPAPLPQVPAPPPTQAGGGGNIRTELQRRKLLDEALAPGGIEGLQPSGGGPAQVQFNAPETLRSSLAGVLEATGDTNPAAGLQGPTTSGQRPLQGAVAPAGALPPGATGGVLQGSMAGAQLAGEEGADIARGGGGQAQVGPGVLGQLGLAAQEAGDLGLQGLGLAGRVAGRGLKEVGDVATGLASGQAASETLQEFFPGIGPPSAVGKAAAGVGTVIGDIAAAFEGRAGPTERRLAREQRRSELNLKEMQFAQSQAEKLTVQALAIPKGPEREAWIAEVVDITREDSGDNAAGALEYLINNSQVAGANMTHVFAAAPPGFRDAVRAGVAGKEDLIKLWLNKDFRSRMSEASANDPQNVRLADSAMAELMRSAKQDGLQIDSWDDLNSYFSAKGKEIFPADIAPSESTMKNIQWRIERGDYTEIGVEGTEEGRNTRDRLADERAKVEQKLISDQLERASEERADLRKREAEVRDFERGLTKAQIPTFKDKLQMFNKFSQDSRSFAEIRDRFEKIVVSVQDPSAAGDLSLIFAYMKMLDPESVVREGEQATARNAGGVPESIRALWNRGLEIVKGGKSVAFLSPNVRQDFLNRGERLFGVAIEGQKRLENASTERARRFGIDPRDVVRSEFLEGVRDFKPGEESSEDRQAELESAMERIEQELGTTDPVAVSNEMRRRGIIN